MICNAAKGVSPICHLESSGITLEVVKKAEKEPCFILRLVENRGERSRGKLVFTSQVNVAETSLLEWEEKEIASSVETLEIELAPFEIRTLKLRRKN